MASMKTLTFLSFGTMSPRQILAVLMCGVIVGSVATAASLQPPYPNVDDAATREAVTRVKLAIVEGHRTRDKAALDALYAPDYLAFDARGGARTKADLLAALPTDPEMIEGRYEITRVRRWGSIAVASGRGRMSFRQPDGSIRRAEYDSVNVFEERGGRWWYAAAFLP